MKKLFAILLALCLVLSAWACTTTTPGSDPTDAPEVVTDDAQGAGDTDATEPDDTTDEDATTPDNTAVSADDIEDLMTSDDGTYELAFVTDVGMLKDKSFNEGTWNGVKLYAYEHGLSYKYYQPANGNEATDDDRYDAMKAAAEAGAKVVVCAGYLQETALKRAAVDFPDTMFVFIDGYELSDDAGNLLTNVAGISFQEEQPGYFAGYAVVKDGFTKLGFCGGGGGTNPACCRYGYGFVQGANAAAAEMGVQVEINYSWQYGSSYAASPELQTMANGWYVNGTEVIFACGGMMFTSITAAASTNDGYVVGVDVDQSSQSDTVITSAMKGIGAAAQLSIGKYYDGTWDEIGGKNTALGVADDAVGLPTDTWSLTGLTVEEYQKVYDAVKDGSLVIDTDYETGLTQEWSNVTLNII